MRGRQSAALTEYSIVIKNDEAHPYIGSIDRPPPNGINFRNGVPEVKPGYFLPVLYATAWVEMNRVLSIQAH